MEIKLNDVGKQYRYVWILRHITEALSSGERWAIIGPNGTGKSTLIKILSGFLTPTEGQVAFMDNGKKIDEPGLLLNFTAPYISLLEEFTAREMCAFHASRRPWINGITTDHLIRIAQFEDHTDKQIRYFSTGMKQRLKVALALLTASSAILLDEPCSNFDQHYREWYHELVKNYLGDRLLVVASNDTWDYAWCDRYIRVG